MCYLISVLVLDFDGNLSEHFRPYNLVASPTRNPTVLRALPGMPYDITDGHCSCAFYGMPDAIDRVEAQLTEARERYQKTGWSQTKIDRALEGKSRSLSRRARSYPRARGPVERRGLRDPVHGRREPGEMASRAHHVVLRDCRAGQVRAWLQTL